MNASPYVGFHKDARGVRNLWERFNAGALGGRERCTPYQQLLLDEWQRCAALGVDVAMSRGRRLGDEEFRWRKDAERLLLETSLPIVEEVSQFLIDVPGIMILADRTGTILHITGDPRVRERASNKSGIVEGSVWNEPVAGTNGMGTALAKGRPVHVFATEHFCEGWHSWSCAAAPIFDVDGQSVIGIIDFTTIETDFRDQALGLAVSVANSIQTRMSLHRALERRRILAAFSDTARRYPDEDMLAFDQLGRPMAFTPNQRCRELAAHRDSEDQAAAQMRAVIDVKAPNSESRIGSIVLLGGAPSRGPSARVAAPAIAEEISRFGDFATCDAATRSLFKDLRRIAAAEVNLLIVGETGTGKELLARHVHASSPRRDEPYLAVNCGAISEQLMESTFFGYVRGAFSGADPRGRAGYFESAKGGTLFLDEVAELPLAMQAALLRVLEDGSFQRVGSCETRRATCRIIAATHRNLEQLIAEGRFRQDLYFRLKVVQHTIKPLRERPDDIRMLAAQFAETLGRKHGLETVRITPEAFEVLAGYSWPGNVRELRNAIEAALLCSTGSIEVENLPAEIRTFTGGGDNDMAQQPIPALQAPALACDRPTIITLLRKYRKANRVATVLGIARSTLYRKFAEFGINPSDFINSND